MSPKTSIPAPNRRQFLVNVSAVGIALIPPTCNKQRQGEHALSVDRQTGRG